MDNVDTTKLERLLDRLRKATSDPGRIHVCPVCGGCLQVEFEPYFRKQKEALGIRASCESCGVALAADYDQKWPAWLKKPQRRGRSRLIK